MSDLQVFIQLTSDANISRGRSPSAGFVSLQWNIPILLGFVPWEFDVCLSGVTLLSPMEAGYWPTKHKLFLTCDEFFKQEDRDH
jgi:hypothetical protein